VVHNSQYLFTSLLLIVQKDASQISVVKSKYGYVIMNYSVHNSFKPTMISTVAVVDLSKWGRQH